MNEDMPCKPVKATHYMRSVGIEAVLLLVVFLLGFVPMWLKSREADCPLVGSGAPLEFGQDTKCDGLGRR